MNVMAVLLFTYGEKLDEPGKESELRKLLYKTDIQATLKVAFLIIVREWGLSIGTGSTPRQVVLGCKGKLRMPQRTSQ